MELLFILPKKMKKVRFILQPEYIFYSNNNDTTVSELTRSGQHYKFNM